MKKGRSIFTKVFFISLFITTFGYLLFSNNSDWSVLVDNNLSYSAKEGIGNKLISYARISIGENNSGSDYGNDDGDDAMQRLRDQRDDRRRMMQNNTDDRDSRGSSDRSTRNSAPAVPVPSAPAGITVACDPSGTQATISWSPVSEITHYAVRYDRDYSSWNNNCGKPNSGDYCNDKHVEASRVVQATPGKENGTWVHACNKSGCSSEIASTTFTCTASAAGVAPSSSTTSIPPTVTTPPPPPAPEKLLTITYQGLVYNVDNQGNISGNGVTGKMDFATGNLTLNGAPAGNLSNLTGAFVQYNAQGGGAVGATISGQSYDYYANMMVSGANYVQSYNSGDSVGMQAAADSAVSYLARNGVGAEKININKVGNSAAYGYSGNYDVGITLGGDKIDQSVYKASSNVATPGSVSNPSTSSGANDAKDFTGITSIVVKNPIGDVTWQIKLRKTKYIPKESIVVEVNSSSPVVVDQDATYKHKASFKINGITQDVTHRYGVGGGGSTFTISAQDKIGKYSIEVTHDPRENGDKVSYIPYEVVSAASLTENSSGNGSLGSTNSTNYPQEVFMSPATNPCGIANNLSFANQPTVDLCSPFSGGIDVPEDANNSVRTMSNNNGWQWDCKKPGSRGGEQGCQAWKTNDDDVHGECGDLNGKKFPISFRPYVNESNACLKGRYGVGNMGAIYKDGDTTNWTCTGTDKEAVPCSFTTKESGYDQSSSRSACGSVDGQTVSSKPTENLCVNGYGGSVTEMDISNSKFPRTDYKGVVYIWQCKGYKNAGRDIADRGEQTHCYAIKRLDGGEIAPELCSSANGLGCVPTPPTPPTPAANSCGSSANKPLTSAPTDNLCPQGATMVGTVTKNTLGGWFWTCKDKSGKEETCTTSTPQGGFPSCSYQNGGVSQIKPSGSVCERGKGSEVEKDNGRWEWTCENGNKEQDCFSYPAISEVGSGSKVDGECGSSDGETLDRKPKDLCDEGDDSEVIEANNKFKWVCEGSSGGKNVACSATRKAGGIKEEDDDEQDQDEENESGNQPKCGSATEKSSSSKPTADLCEKGKSTLVSASFQGSLWKWYCVTYDNENPPAVKSCEAKKELNIDDRLDEISRKDPSLGERIRSLIDYMFSWAR